VTRRLAILLAPAALCAALAGCGGSQPAAPGSPERPLVAKPGEVPSEPSSTGRSTPAKGSSAYAQIVQDQTAHPRSRFTPCNLVTRPEAQAIMGGSVRAPLEAPQGPTCIYRAAKGDGMVTLAVQEGVSFASLKPQLQGRKTVDASGRTGYCGMYGQPVLFVPLTGGRVLTVGAECGVAQRFAAKAVRQLHG
jgi:hypothetical protein